MLFTGIGFLFVFLPITLLVDYVLPSSLRNYWLLIVSLVFYAVGEPVFVFVMQGSILFNYCMALLIESRRLQCFRKVLYLQESH